MLFPLYLELLYGKQVKIFLDIIRRVMRKIYTLSIVFFCVTYFFATLGIFLFGGLISLDENNSNYNSLLSSFYGQNQFWKINFNDFTNAFITLFCLIHVSDFDVIASGFVAVTNTYARIYFVAWYLIGVVLILNIIKSFFLTDLIVWVKTSNTISEEKKFTEEDILLESIKTKNEF